MKVSTRSSNEAVVCLSEVILGVRGGSTVVDVVTAQGGLEVFILSKPSLLLVSGSNDLVVKCSSTSRNSNPGADIDASGWASEAGILRC